MAARKSTKTEEVKELEVDLKSSVVTEVGAAPITGLQTLPLELANELIEKGIATETEK